MLFKEALQQYRCYLRKSHFDGKSINEFPVKSPVLNLEDIEWKNLVMMTDGICIDNGWAWHLDIYDE